MVDESAHEAEGVEPLDEEQDSAGRMSNAERRDRLASLDEKLGERSNLDGEVIVVEVGEPVRLHIELDREGWYTATWWATAQSDIGHHRWREVADRLMRDGEAIHTSALGGGYLIELVREDRSDEVALAWATETQPLERVSELLEQFPAGVAELDPEPVPDYLLPPKDDDAEEE